MRAERLGKYKARKVGRGYVVTIPQEWIDGAGLDMSRIELEAHSVTYDSDETSIVLFPREREAAK